MIIRTEALYEEMCGEFYLYYYMCGMNYYESGMNYECVDYGEAEHEYICRQLGYEDWDVSYEY